MSTSSIPAPPDLDKPIRERYRAIHQQISGDREWPRGKVQLTKDDEVIYEYTRNYSFMDTFEPFRQWNGERWHNYALISPRYSTFSVLDLETAEVIAERPYPQRNWFTGEYEKLMSSHPEYFQPGGAYEGKTPDSQVSGEGFCPTQFYVPDYASWDSDWEGSAGPEEHMTPEDWESFAEDEEVHTGQLGFVAGCYWGDDSSWKIQAIDLSRISEGIVTQDDRFGYLELPPGLKLKQAVSWVSGDRIRIASSMTYDRNSGKLKSWQRSSFVGFEEEGS